MTTHQLIYTSCRRGINGVNDGQQVFSFDAGFPTDQIPAMAPLMTYRGPDLPPGVPMSEALVPTYPKSFTYSPLGRYADLALNTYLGKDYMGPTGRFGNFLSHHVVLEELPSHPAEFIGSSAFRTFMDYAEVNSAEPPLHLPAPEVVPGGQVSRDSVRLFLEVDDRWPTFTRMAACMLAGPATHKGVVLHDRPESVVQWIGALGYLLPLGCASQVSFSTYEYNPSRSSWRIAGAIAEGTLYEQATSSAYVFDLVAGTAPELDLPEDFADFLEVGLLISSDSLIAFHQFVEVNFPQYRAADTALYGAYALFQLDLGEFQPDTLGHACTFLSQYGTEVQRIDFLNAVLGQPGGIALVTDPNTRPTLLAFTNGIAHNGIGLLELTFNAEGNLLDAPNAQVATEIMWANFYGQMVDSYPSDSRTVYRELLSDPRPRLHEARALFSTFLKQAGGEAAKRHFDEVIELLPSSREYPTFVDAYYAYATTPADRAHLLRFIMAHEVTFKSAGTLVAESLSEVGFGGLTEDQSSYVKRVWQWAQTADVDIRQSQRLWHLVAGLGLTSANSVAQLASNIEWVVGTASQLGLRPVVDDPEFVEWVVPQLLRVADSGRTLHRFLTRLGFRLTPALLDLMWDHAFRKFERTAWLKVAECVFDYRDDRLLDQFAQGCKKLSNREIAELQQEATVRWAGDPRLMRNWETVYAATQSTAMRSVKAWIGKRGEGRGRTEG